MGYYDYSAVIYPVGQFDQNNILFNENQIEEVLFRGYESEQEKELKIELEVQQKKYNILILMSEYESRIKLFS